MQVICFELEGKWSLLNITKEREYHRNGDSNMDFVKQICLSERISTLKDRIKIAYSDGLLPTHKGSPIEYGKLLLEFERTPLVYSILAPGFAWVLLAGYLVLPGTFASLRSSKTLKPTATKNEIGSNLYDHIERVPLLWAAGILCCIGVIGELVICWKLKRNLVFLIRKIFM